MRAFSAFSAFVAATAQLSSGAAVVAPPPTQVVAGISEKLAKVLHAGGLAPELRTEAEHVQGEARAALARASGNSTGLADTGLTETVVDFRAFLAHLTRREASLRGAGGQAGQVEPKAAQLLPRLRAAAEKLARDIAVATEGETAAERVAIVARLQAALGDQSGGALEQVLRLHQSLEAAEDLLRQRTKRLSGQEAVLKKSIEDQQLWLLYKMLRQRKMLPMSTQVAMLRRPSFANISWAVQLLHNHTESEPLVTQLEALLPKATVARMLNPPRHRKRLAPAGAGDGSMTVVSSRMKNAVKGMAQVLAHARDQLAALEAHPPKGCHPSSLQRARPSWLV